MADNKITSGSAQSGDGTGFEMDRKWGTIAMLISATGMVLCPCSAAGERAPTCSTERRG